MFRSPGKHTLYILALCDAPTHMNLSDMREKIPGDFRCGLRELIPGIHIVTSCLQESRNVYHAIEIEIGAWWARKTKSACSPPPLAIDEVTDHIVIAQHTADLLVGALSYFAREISIVTVMIDHIRVPILGPIMYVV